MSRTAAYLEAAADRVMIQDLVARYALEVDYGTPEAFAATFCEDGVFEIPAVRLRCEGREAIADFAEAVQRTLPPLHHVISNHAIEVDGDRAHGRCELNEFSALPDVIIPNVQGLYEDDYIFDGSGWLIERRSTSFAASASGAIGPLKETSRAFFAAVGHFVRQ